MIFMKKISLSVLSLISFAFMAVTAGGCDKTVRPEFTAESPFYHATDFIQNNKIYKNFNYNELPPSTDPYEEFERYYKTQFKAVSDKQFYVLDLGEPCGDMATDRRRSCNIYGNLNTEEKLENPFLSQSVEIYDKELGGYYDKKLYWKDGWTNWSIIFSIFCAPVEREAEGELRLEFGTLNAGTNWFYNNYVNIYIGNICTATCYYVEGVKIPLSWYENYFKNNLIYGGNL